MCITCVRFEEKESVSGVQQLKSSVQKGIRTKLVDQYPHLESYVDVVLPKKDTYRIVKCHDHIEILANSAGELLFFRHREGPWVPTLRLLHKFMASRYRYCYEQHRQLLSATWHSVYWCGGWFCLLLRPRFLGGVSGECGRWNLTEGRQDVFLYCPVIIETRQAWGGWTLELWAVVLLVAIFPWVTTDPFILPWEQVDKGAIRFVLSGANIMCPGLTSPGAQMTPVIKGTIVAVMAEGKQHALAVGITALSTDEIAKVNKGIGIENYHYLNDGLWQMKPVK
ncbi:hypothetical protein PR048_000488 [Dryococelus australis]|uniref:PUA domain-containing protein n=1 Tax=Dryococelus australis TaxID=614101 RepID=A0ABQ9IH34_9NEOP|nr:hypothetical protein PR048_000488 [Dryococelus australis]